VGLGVLAVLTDHLHRVSLALSTVTDLIACRKSALAQHLSNRIGLIVVLATHGHLLLVDDPVLERDWVPRCHFKSIIDS
jgi:hypothetical protein